jgi:hypothetical protein
MALMQAPLFVRPLTADEQAALEAGLHAAAGCTVRRCHMLLANAAGQHTTTIARTLRCNEQTVRNARNVSSYMRQLRSTLWEHGIGQPRRGARRPQPSHPRPRVKRSLRSGAA